MLSAEHHHEINERVPFYASVGILVAGADYPSLRTNGLAKLLLVRQRETQQWGLVAGALNIGETPQEAIRRELKEEAFFGPEDIVIVNEDNPMTMLLMTESHNSLGFIFEGYLRIDLPHEGYSIHNGETDWLRQFLVRASSGLDLVELVHNPALLIDLILTKD